ncbi:MAG: response regulator [Kiritimatiellae bacterium]|nr:response regulator [Kiritimatiellia bacterium]
MKSSMKDVVQKRAVVWVVDDEETVCEALGAVLRKLGYDTRLFSNSEEALREYLVARPDVVITDVRMPGMDGMALTRAILNADPYAIVMILTAYPSIPDAVQVVKEGATDYLSKPIKFDEIRVRIERALENRYAVGRVRRMRMAIGVLVAVVPLLIIIVLLVLLFNS